MRLFRNNKEIAGSLALAAFFLILFSGLYAWSGDPASRYAASEKIVKTDSLASAGPVAVKSADGERKDGSSNGKMPIALPDIKSAYNFFLSFFRTFRPSASAVNDSVPASEIPAGVAVIRS